MPRLVQFLANHRPATSVLERARRHLEGTGRSRCSPAPSEENFWIRVWHWVLRWWSANCLELVYGIYLLNLDYMVWCFAHCADINCDFHVRFRLCSRVGCLRMCTTVPRGSEMFATWRLRWFSPMFGLGFGIWVARVLNVLMVVVIFCVWFGWWGLRGSVRVGFLFGVFGCAVNYLR